MHLNVYDKVIVLYKRKQNYTITELRSGNFDTSIAKIGTNIEKNMNIRKVSRVWPKSLFLNSFLRRYRKKSLKLYLKVVLD